MSNLGNKQVFAENLKYWLDRAGKTPADLIVDLSEYDFKKSTVYGWLKEVSYPRIDKIEILAAYFSKLLVRDIQKSDLIEPLRDDADIVTIYNKLNSLRKQKVVDFANRQLSEQNNVVAFPTPAKTQISVYGAVSAGNGEYLLDGQPELVDYEGTVPEHDFAVIVNGDSMEPLFTDKQIIFVRKTSDARHGQIVIADVDGEAFVKKLSIDTDETRLVSLNPRYKDIVIKDQNDFSIFGVVQL